MTHPDFERLTGIEAIRYLLLDKYHLYFEPENTRHAAESISEKYLRAADLLFADYGYAMSNKLRHHVAGYTSESFKNFTQSMVRAMRSLRGMYDDFVPLYYSFPDAIPEDMDAEWLKRFVALFRDPDAPCLYCGTTGSTVVLEPCHHIVCSQCFDMSNCSACPICRHAVNIPDSPRKRHPENEAVTIERIDFNENFDKFVQNEIQIFCRSSQPIPKRDTLILKHICEVYGEKILTWLLPDIVLRENAAVIFGTLLRLKISAAWLDSAKRYIHTVTDILRMIAVMSGRPASLAPVNTRKTITVHRASSIPHLPVAPYVRKNLAQTYPDQSAMPKNGIDVTIFYPAGKFKVCPLSRPMRRMILAFLESFPESAIIEDMLRYRTQWVHIAGTALHPSEYADKFPKTAAAFAVIRRKNPDGTKVTAPETWNHAFELAMKTADISKAQNLIDARPAELARRLDWMMRTAETKYAIGNAAEILESSVSEIGNAIEKNRSFSKKCAAIASGIGMTFGKLWKMADDISNDDQNSAFVKWAAPKLIQTPTSDLATLWQHLSMRAHPVPIRVFTPKTSIAKKFFAPDSRSPLPTRVTNPVRSTILGELLQRFGQKKHFESCIIDESLKTIPAPYAEQTNDASGPLLPAGSVIDMPQNDAETIRLFLHWCRKEHGRRADLDLSVVFYDKKWNKRSTCSYFENTAKIDKIAIAVHSGDRQDAPWPDGASEFIDINRTNAQNCGIRYAVASVMCYNDIGFSQLSRAFTGLVFRRAAHAAAFDPRTVRYRFALSGALKNYIPLIIDFSEKHIIIADTFLSSPQNININALSESKELIRHALNMTKYPECNSHISRYHLALMHAASRSSSVIIRMNDGAVCHFHRHDDESACNFFSRMLQNQYDGSFSRIKHAPGSPSVPILAFLSLGNIEFAPGSETCIVFPDISSSSVEWSHLLENK